MLTWEQEAAGRLLHAHDGLARRARGAQFPADRPETSPLDLGPEGFLDRIGVFEGEIAKGLRKGYQQSAAGSRLDQALDGGLDGDGHLGDLRDSDQPQGGAERDLALPDQLRSRGRRPSPCPSAYGRSGPSTIPRALQAAI